MASDTKPVVVFVLGGPGAGKGTQCSRISEQLGFKHISAGDCLREERNTPGSEFGEMIQTYIREGRIVPVDVTCNLLKKKMQHYGWNGGKFLIDGFPRNQDNLDGWFRIMKDDVDVKFCLFLDCPEEEMLQRLVKRGKSSGRVDDNVESIRKRFHTYVNETKPIIEFFQAGNKCRKVNAIGTVDEVWEEVCASFKECA